VNSKDYYEKNSNKTPEAKLREQLSRFGLVQRGEHGMHLLDADLKDMMLRQNIRPDSYIMPPRAVSYINMRDPYMTEYERGGRGAEALAPLGEAPTFRGTRVYEARYFETDYVSEPHDPMVQVITYAEWYPALEGLHIFDMKHDDWMLVHASSSPVAGGVKRSEAASKEDITGIRNSSRSSFRDLKFHRFKGIKDADGFMDNYIPTLDPAHQQAVIDHLNTLEAGSVVRPAYITDFIKTL